MKNIYWPLIVSASISVGIVLGGYIVSFSLRTDVSSHTMNSSKLKLNKLIDFINEEYVDDVNTDSIVDNTVTTVLQQLDPFSTYITPNVLDRLSESMKGNFIGIGINYYVLRDTLTVIGVVPGGPSDKSGLLPGDRILFADGQKLFNENLSNDSLMTILRGEENTLVKLGVFRKKDNSHLDIDLKRSIIPIKSVDAALKFENGFGYIKVNRFSETTYDEFKRDLKNLKEKDFITGLIIDLRGNGGGYMEQAINMVDELLDDNEVIVKTVNKRGNERVSMSTPKGFFKQGKLYILIDENTASASEIVAGAIQDNDRGTIVGRRSFGKGLVQRDLLLGDGSAVRLTTARYYTPSGRSIQKPYNNDIYNYDKAFSSRYERGELYAADSIKIADSLQFKTKKGKIVYGGGGIVPDLFVPTDSNHGEEAITILMNSGMVTNFVFEQIDSNRNVFEKYGLNELKKNVVQGKIYNDFKKLLKENGLHFNADKRKETIEFYLTAEFIRQLSGEKYYYQWILGEDPMIKAIYNQQEG